MEGASKSEVKLSEQKSQSTSCSSIPWTPKVCKIIAFMAVILGLGL